MTNKAANNMPDNTQLSGLPLSGLPLSVASSPNIGFVLADEQFPVQELLRYGELAERAGFDAVWSSDHYQPWQDNEGHANFAWLTLAALGERTDRIIMGTGVTCPTYRYRPAIVAQGFATLANLNPGRIFLGIGTGEALNEQAATGEWGDYDERSTRMIEAVEIIRQLWTGEIVNYQGKYYTVKDAKLYDRPPRAIPIYLAAGAEHSMRLAGQYGDGLITDSERALKSEFRKAFEEGARSAGKDPKTMPIIAETWVVVGNEEEARKYAPLWQFLPNAWSEFVDNHDPRDIERKALQEVPLDKVLKSWIVGEDPQAHIKKLKELIDGGITTLVIHSPQPDQGAVISWYSKNVLPALKGQQAGANRSEAETMWPAAVQAPTQP